MTPNHSIQVAAYFAANKSKYDFSTIEGCGKYTEDCVRECLRPLDFKWGLLAYTGNGTKYNGHRIDSILYSAPDIGDSLLRSIDIIINAESSNASSGWIPDSVARYTLADWIPYAMTPPVTTVPWVAYNESGFQKLKNLLSFDYSRRPQGADFDVTVWAARVFHSAYMGPNGKPLGLDSAIDKHRPEWCAALGVSYPLV